MLTCQLFDVISDQYVRMKDTLTIQGLTFNLYVTFQNYFEKVRINEFEKEFSRTISKYVF